MGILETTNQLDPGTPTMERKITYIRVADKIRNEELNRRSGFEDAATQHISSSGGGMNTWPQ